VADTTINLNINAGGNAQQATANLAKATDDAATSGT